MRIQWAARCLVQNLKGVIRHVFWRPFKFFYLGPAQSCQSWKVTTLRRPTAIIATWHMLKQNISCALSCCTLASVQTQWSFIWANFTPSCAHPSHVGVPLWTPRVAVWVAPVLLVGCCSQIRRFSSHLAPTSSPYLHNLPFLQSTVACLPFVFLCILVVVNPPLDGPSSWRYYCQRWVSFISSCGVCVGDSHHASNTKPLERNGPTMIHENHRDSFPCVSNLIRGEQEI